MNSIRKNLKGCLDGDPIILSFLFLVSSATYIEKRNRILNQVMAATNPNPITQLFPKPYKQK
jgi:hypothetical protein